ncbi:MAG: fumarylacetoacetate hydrolase family protein [candidate division Zixibacteria bacterium]|nr:fumarylacetoacetate hydrolase family protein [candidate division Zixibacteria bacterium]
MTRFVRFAHQGGTYWGTHESDCVRRWGGPPYAGGVSTARTYALDSVTWLPPVVPGKIVAVGLNYAPHVAESASADRIPDEPVLFLKAPTALLAPGGTIILPEDVGRVDYEGELGVVIGQGGRLIRPEGAAPHILGWTIVNDVTARDLQKKDKQWTRAKGFDTFCPVGPWVQTEWDLARSRLSTRVNGQVRQETTFDQMIFPVPQLIAFISRVMTLHPGDLILTGTPAGVGPLTSGDRVDIEVSGLGVLSNSVQLEGNRNKDI